MLDRYSGWLNYKNAIGDVMAESRGREEDLQLRQAYRRVYESGTLMFTHEHHQRALTSREIKIRHKTANIAGLQLADVLAHPVKHLMFSERGMVPMREGCYGEKVCAAIRSKFNINAWKNQVDGYGKVWL
jgi:hypothetical protein